MHFGFNNPYNYVRVSELEPVSIESLAILVAVIYLLYLAYQKRASLEIAYFLALPFSDEPFRIAASVQPVEVVSLLLVALNYRKLRLNYIILMAGVFIMFSLIGYETGNVQSAYPLLYSLRFLLTGLTFSIFIKEKWQLPLSVIRFAVGFTFAMTFLQVILWIAGLPIHGIFYTGIFPRAKGLAHEPGTWAIWVVTLFAFIYHFKLGRLYLWLNIATLLMTFSTFGLISTLTFLLIRGMLLVSRNGLPGRLRIRKSRLRAAGAMIVMVLLLFAFKPDLLDSASDLLTVFDKLSYYQQELAQFASGQTAQEGAGVEDLSGRGRDFTYFQNYFPEHWIVGIGSWNTDPNINGAGTNTYLIMPVEIGVTGTTLIFALMLLHWHMLLRNKDRKSVDFLAASLNFLVMIAGIRCFAFHELWYTQAALLRTAEQRETEVSLSDQGKTLLPQER